MRNVLRSLFSAGHPGVQDGHLDAFMADDAPPAAVQPLLRALAADPRSDELSGLSDALGHYRDAFPVSVTPARTTWRNHMLSAHFGVKVGAAVAGLTLALGGTAFAAYSGSLPSAAQNLAHTVIGAPAAPPSSVPPQRPSAASSESEDAAGATESASAAASVSATPVGPDASGPAAFGLCTAWTAHQSGGASTNPEDSVAFKNLATAAGGVDKIAAYCATVTPPSSSMHPEGSRPSTLPTMSHPTGRPSTLPTQVATR